MEKKKIKLAPSLMCCDLMNVESELEILAEYKVDQLHLDVMDGKYVPNFTLGVDFCRQVDDKTDIPLDIHLMVEKVGDFIDIFSYVPGSIITIHPETSWHPVRVIQQIRDMDCKPGIGIDPSVPIERIAYLLPMVDVACVMTVNPGYAGQPLLPFTLDKVAELKEYCEKNNIDIDIQVDGCVSFENIPKMIAAGANVMVAGTSSIFSRTRPRRECLDEYYELVASLDI